MNMNVVVSIAGPTLAVCAMIASLMAVKAVRRWRTQCESLEASIASLRRELDRVASICVRTGRRVQRVEQQFSGVTERVDLVESRSSARSESLDQAIDLARRGADPNRLEQQFGLTTGEAELVTRLHGRDRQTAPKKRAH
jgi:septal ring factor EnvC (AmiA/AmiB activator)